MKTTKSCTIRLLNKSYEIKCPEHETDSLAQAALKLNAQVLETKQKYRQLEDYDALLLAALHISHEVITCQSQQEQQRQQLALFISSLENKISQATADISLPELA